MTTPHVPSAAPPRLDPIAWNRLAEPQDDQYDSLVVLELARRKGYVRPAPGARPTTFDGRIAVRTGGPAVGPDCVPAPADHPSVARAAELVRLWPTMFTQMQALIDSVDLFVHTASPYHDDGVGSMSGHGGSDFGVVASTVNSPVGLAGSLAHEMAHHKLRAMGVQFESAERLITNPPGQTFRSPVRYDCLRPMPAVLHGQYAFTYSAAVCLEVVKRGADAALSRRVAEDVLAVKLPKLVFGLEVLKRHAETDDAGAALLDGLYDWCYRLFEEGFARLDDMGVPVRRFAHPLRV